MKTARLFCFVFFAVFSLPLDGAFSIQVGSVGFFANPKNNLEMAARQFVAWQILGRVFEQSSTICECPVDINTQIVIYDEYSSSGTYSLRDLLLIGVDKNFINRPLNSQNNSTLLELALFNNIDIRIVIMLLNNGAIWWSSPELIQAFFSKSELCGIKQTDSFPAELLPCLHPWLKLDIDHIISGVRQYLQCVKEWGGDFESAIVRLSQLNQHRFSMKQRCDFSLFLQALLSFYKKQKAEYFKSKEPVNFLLELGLYEIGGTIFSKDCDLNNYFFSQIQPSEKNWTAAEWSFWIKRYQVNESKSGK